MVQKSRDLDKKLAEILVPVGFKKIPKSRCYIRLFGDGVIQAFFWYHEPRYSAQELSYRINSIWADPDQLFRRHLLNKGWDLMIGWGSCAQQTYGDDEYIPARDFSEPTEEQQVVKLLEHVLPRFERWKRQEDVLFARQGMEIPLGGPHYHYGDDLNIALYLEKTEEIEKYINRPIAFERERIAALKSKGYPCERLENNLHLFLNKKVALNSPVKTRAYLLRCKEQNLKDYEDVLAGKAGTSDFANDFVPFFVNTWDS